MDSLPTELVQEICYSLRGKDLKNFRLTKKDINEIAEECLWNTQTLVLNLNRQQLSAGMEMLEDLKNRCRTACLVRAMIIDSLAPQRVSRYQPREEYKGFEVIEESELAVVKKACEDLPKLLTAAISALTNLRHITWGINSPDQDTVPNDKDVMWSHEAFLQLAKLPHLNDIILGTNAVPAIPLPPIDRLRHVECFTIKGNWDVSDTTAPWTLAPMIANNPKLVSLDLSPWCATTDHRSTFHNLFDHIDSQSPPLQLEHLALHGWMVAFTPSVVPHMRNLTSISFPYNSQRYVGIWGILKNEGIHLRDIRMGNAGDEFLGYMESFSGIETLTVCGPEAISIEENSRLSRRFFGSALLKHTATLYDLQIGLVMDGPWSVGLDNAATFGRCEALESLTVPLRIDDINPGKGEEQDVVALLISSVLHLQYLDYICLKPHLPPHHPFEDFASPIEARMFKEQQRLRIVEALEKYKVSKARLPSKDYMPPFLVSTLTPNGHYLDDSPDEGMLAFVRESTFNSDDDSFHFINLDSPLMSTDNSLIIMDLTDLDIHTLVNSLA